MATGGAWHSEYFERPSGVQSNMGAQQRAETTQPAGPGPLAPPPPMYNTSGSDHRGPTKGRGTIVAALALRLLTFLLALAALALVVAGKGTFGVSTNSTGTDYFKRTVRFTILGAGKYLFAACIAVAVYSLAMIALNAISLCVTALAYNKILLAITFILDQGLAYMLIAAGAAAANAVVAVTNDAENVTGLKDYGVTCAELGIDGMCSTAAAAVALAMVAFLFLAITSVLSARRFFRN